MSQDLQQICSKSNSKPCFDFKVSTKQKHPGSSKFNFSDNFRLPDDQNLSQQNVRKSRFVNYTASNSELVDLKQQDPYKFLSTNFPHLQDAEIKKLIEEDSSLDSQLFKLNRDKI